MNIVIIGCGNIGFRHFESIVNSELECNLLLVDTNQKAFEKYKNHNSKVDIKFYDRIENYDRLIDIAIICTTSRKRAELLKCLLKTNKVKSLILEKFLFTKLSDYQEMHDLFLSKKIKVWVNQWMSSERHFVELSKYFINSPEEIEMKISGNNWGMCCNSVHYIDYFHYLSRRTKLVMHNSCLSNKIIESKRKGYYELFGAYEVHSANGNILSVECSNKNAGELKYFTNIEINSSSSSFKGKYSLGQLNGIYNLKGKKIEIDYKLDFQSKMTESLVRSIKTKNDCDLPIYKQSMSHHKLVFEEFKKIFELNNYDISEGIPIT